MLIYFDKIQSKEILTFKSGKFIFSARYSRLQIDPLLAEVSCLLTVLRKIPIFPEHTTKLNTELVRKSIHGTAAIEGNPLSEEQVAEIIESSAPLNQKIELEIANLKNAYKYVKKEFGKQKEFSILSDDDIREIHRMVMSNVLEGNDAGIFRSHKVKVGDVDHGGVYIPPKNKEDVKTLMHGFCSWYNDVSMQSCDVIIRAALAHYYIAKIHPFPDGNGRTARLAEALVLSRSGIKFLPNLISNYCYNKIDEYYIAFSQTHSKKDDVTDFLKFVLTGIVHALRDTYDTVLEYVRDTILLDFYRHSLKERNLSKRTHALLVCLFERGIKITQSDLFSDPVLKAIYHNVSEQTARRDLRKLTENKFLIKNKDQFKINSHLLDIF